VQRVLVVLATVSALQAQPVPDPTDSLLLARLLTPQQEAQFSRTDGAVSAFWSDWIGQDSILLAPPGDCETQPCSLDGPTDASLVVKAAAGTAGLYLSVEVTDDVWTAPSGTGDDWYRDVISLYLDTLSASEVMAPCPPAWECWSRMTTSTHEIRPFAGAMATADSCDFGRYVPAVWAWTRSRESVPDMPAVSGYELEVVRADPSLRVLELRVPWDRYCGGLGAGSILDSRHLAFWTSYDDCDGTDSAAHADRLRWLGPSPWFWDAAWGDIVLPEGLGTVITRVAPGSRHGAVPAQVRATLGSPSAQYSLTGQLVREAGAAGGVSVLPVHGRAEPRIRLPR